MPQEKQKYTAYGSRQQLFIKYTLAVLIDLVVLGLFNQYWDYVSIETFTIADDPDVKSLDGNSKIFPEEI